MSLPVAVPVIELPGGARLELSESVLDNAPVGMLLSTASGHVLWSNQAMAQVLGVAPSALVGRCFDDLVARSDAEVLAADVRVLLGGQPVPEREMRWPTADGHRWVSIRASLALRPDRTPLVNGDPAEHCIIRQLVDVTFRHEAEERLAALHAALGERNRALEQSNEDLTRFALVASHDLSEPLRVIAGHVDLLKARYDSVLDERGREWMAFVVDGCERMRALIDDLLLYGRVGQELTLVRVGLDELVRAARRRLHSLLVETAAEVHVDGPLPTVTVDAGAFTQVLTNLLSNAVKYTRPGASPSVRVAAHGTEDGWRLTVADDGVGIPERHRERALQLFQRLHGREVAGTGIGLPICRRVVERHGGTLSLTETPGGGLTVIVDMPAVPLQTFVAAP